MKKIIAFAAALATLTATTATAEKYINFGMVTEVTNGVAVVQDLYGEEWVIKEVDDLYELDYIVIVADDMNTDCVYDDEIVDWLYVLSEEEFF